VLPPKEERKKMKNQIIDLDEDPENADWLHQIRKRKEAKMTKYDEKYYRYLDGLRESGISNMFGARPFLRSKFRELTDPMATKVLGDWMKTFHLRHPKKQEENSGQESN